MRYESQLRAMEKEIRKVFEDSAKLAAKQLENAFPIPIKAILKDGWYYCHNCESKIAKHLSGLNFSLEIRCAHRIRKQGGKVCGSMNIVDM
jgi:uncharacterized protein YlaI